MTIDIGTVDHVCLCVTDVERSIKWYHGILGVSLKYANEPNFYPKDVESPAFLQKNDVRIALLPLSNPQHVIRDHRGAHVAFRVSGSEFKNTRKSLPVLLQNHRVHNKQNVEVEEYDYGIQKSLFFSDPDNNILEITTWPNQNLAK